MDIEQEKLLTETLLYLTDSPILINWKSNTIILSEPPTSTLDS